MLSTLAPSNPLHGNPFSTFSGGFTPWDCRDIFLAPSPKPVSSSSGSDQPRETQEKQKPDQDEPNRTHEKRKPDQNESNQVDERKRRRMISNRESARRSRVRKQRHLENLRNQLNKCRMENRELNNRLQFVLHHVNRVRTENEWLRSERTVLYQKLSRFTQILVLQQQLQSFSSSPAWTSNTALITE